MPVPHIAQRCIISSERTCETRRAPPHWPADFTARPSGEVPAWVTAEAGARPWARDAVDRRILQSVVNGTGQVIDDEGEVGGYPTPAPTARSFVEADWDLSTMTRRDGQTG